MMWAMGRDVGDGIAIWVTGHDGSYVVKGGEIGGFNDDSMLVSNN